MLLEAVSGQVKEDWTLFLTRIQWLDIVFVIALALGVFLGLKRGLSKVIPRFLEVVVAQIIAVEYFEYAAELLAKWIPIPAWIIQMLVFSGLAIGLIVLTRFLFQILSLVATIEFKPLVSNVVGALLGGLQFVLLLSLISSFLLLIPAPYLQETYSTRSLSGSYLAKASKQVNQVFTHWLPKVLPDAKKLEVQKLEVKTQ